jgi:hypothetical protein
MLSSKAWILYIIHVHLIFEKQTLSYGKNSHGYLWEHTEKKIIDGNILEANMSLYQSSSYASCRF